MRGFRTFDKSVLHRRTSQSGVVYYASAKLEAIGVPHAFSTRCGGVSPEPFNTLNLGNPSGHAVQDQQDRIQENYHLLLSAIGCQAGWPLRVHQVHGGQVVQVEPDRPFDAGVCADAIVSRDSRRAISVRTADCVPVLISTSDGKTVAAVHAGWRGVISGIVPAAVARMVATSGQPAHSLLAAIGPCIGRDAFEVGEEVLVEFEKAFGRDAPVFRRPGGKGIVDLRQAVRLQLEKCGLGADRIDSTDRCTVAHREEFFSHRRDAGLTGRMAAVIASSRSERP